MWKTKSVFKKNPFTFSNDEIFYVYSSFLLAEDEVIKLKSNISQRFLMPGILSCNFSEKNALKYSKIDLKEIDSINRVLQKIKLDKTGMTTLGNNFYQTGMMLQQDISLMPEEQQLLFLMPMLVFNSYELKHEDGNQDFHIFNV